MTTKKIDHISFGYSYDDFEPFGIRTGSGESCGMGMRLLVDVDNLGAGYIEEFFGDTITIKHGTGWRNGVGSIMLSHAMFKDLAIFLLIRQGHEVVVSRTDHVVAGYTLIEWEEVRERYLLAYPGTHITINRGTAGTRNLHVWTGRVS